MNTRSQKYAVYPYHIEVVLAWVLSGEIAIPEIQRPFVWDATKVRDLMDSLSQGFPVGYLIAWKNPNVRLKDGTLSEGKKISRPNLSMKRLPKNRSLNFVLAWINSATKPISSGSSSSFVRLDSWMQVSSAPRAP